MRRLLVGMVMLPCALVFDTSPASGLTAEELRGQQIFRHGTSASGEEITVAVGKSALEISASAFACATCHGEDGRGRSEGGVTPSDIRWKSLTKPYGVVHADGRSHVPYTERSFKRAVTMGVDPDGNRLNSLMPKYRLSLRDADDLVAYIKRLGESTDPGLTDDSIRIAVMLPPPVPGRETGRAVRTALAAFFEQLNITGGIYDRKVELAFEEPSGSSAGTADALRALLDDPGVFATLTTYLTDAKGEVGALLGGRRVPTVGTFSLRAHSRAALSRYAFYVYADVDHQAQALAQFAARRSAGRERASAIICLDDPVWLNIAAAVRRRLESAGGISVTTVPVSPGAAELATPPGRLADVESLFILTPGPTTEAVFGRVHTLASAATDIFLPGSLGGSGPWPTREPGGGRTWLAFPTLPGDQTRQGIDEYRSLADRYALPKRHRTMQFASLAAAKLLVEGLKRSGRALSRDKLLASLGNLRGFQTDFAPVVEFGPNRRIGSTGSYVISLTDLKTGSFAAAEWIALP